MSYEISNTGMIYLINDIRYLNWVYKIVDILYEISYILNKISEIMYMRYHM